jgi:hypothetical protein
MKIKIITFIVITGRISNAVTKVYVQPSTIIEQMNQGVTENLPLADGIANTNDTIK